MLGFGEIAELLSRAIMIECDSDNNLSEAFRTLRKIYDAIEHRETTFKTENVSVPFTQRRQTTCKLKLRADQLRHCRR